MVRCRSLPAPRQTPTRLDGAPRVDLLVQRGGHRPVGAQQKPSPHQAIRCSRRRSASSIPPKSALVVTGAGSSVTASADSGTANGSAPLAAAGTLYCTPATTAGQRRSPATAGSTRASRGVVPSMLTTTSAPSTRAQAPRSNNAQGFTEGPSQVRTAYPRRSMAEAMIDGDSAGGHSSRTRTRFDSLSSHRGVADFLMARPPRSLSPRLCAPIPHLGSGRRSPASGQELAVQSSDTCGAGHAYARPTQEEMA